MTAVLGRDAERAALLGAAERSRVDGRPRVVLLTGDAGMGKTVLLDDVLSALAAARPQPQTLVLRGTCLDLRQARLPFGPIVQALRPVLRDPQGHGVTLDDPARAELSRLAPELGTPGEPADAMGTATMGHGQLYEHLLRLIERLAAVAGLVVLAIDDLHHATPSTLDLAAFLSANLHRTPVVLLLATRLDELPRAHDVRRTVARMEREPDVLHISLGPLSDAVVAALLRRSGIDEDRIDVAEVLNRAEGNPFHALTLAAHDGRLPESLGDLLLDTVANRGEDATHVLAFLATAGEDTSHTLLADVTSLAPARLDAALREVVDARLVVTSPDDGYRMRHALLREAVEASLLPGESARLHARLAEVLRADGGLRGRHAARLARHLEAAKDPAGAVEAAHAAGMAALRCVAYHEARVLLERVVELWDAVPDAAERTGMDLGEILKTAAVCAISGHEDRRGLQLAERALEEIDTDTDPGRAAMVRMWIGHARRHAGDAALEDYRQAVAMCPADDAARRGRAVAALAGALMLQEHMVEARAAATEAIRLARLADSPRDEAYSLTSLALVEASLSGGIDGVDIMAGRELAERIGRVDYVLRVDLNATDALLHDGRADEVEAIATPAMAIAEQHGLRRSMGVMLQANLVEALNRLGRLEEAARHAEQAHDLVRKGTLGLHAALALAETRVLQGDVDGAAALLPPAGAPGITAALEPQFAVRLAVIRAGVSLARGDRAGALQAATAALQRLALADGAARHEALLAALAVEAGAEDLDGLAAVVDAAVARGEWAVHVAHRRRFLAAVAAARAEQEAEAIPPAAAAAVGQAWQEAAAAYEDVTLPLQQADCLLHTTAWCARGADREAAERSWKAATRLAEDAGAGRLLARAEALGRRAGFLAERSDAAPFGLTARELEVLGLVAEGLTNAEIAERLFITAKTASVHVSNLMRKMGVDTRGRAAAEAYRVGLAG